MLNYYTYTSSSFFLIWYIKRENTRVSTPFLFVCFFDVFSLGCFRALLSYFKSLCPSTKDFYFCFFLYSFSWSFWSTSLQLPRLMPFPLTPFFFGAGALFPTLLMSFLSILFFLCFFNYNFIFHVEELCLSPTLVDALPINSKIICIFLSFLM